MKEDDTPLPDVQTDSEPVVSEDTASAEDTSVWQDKVAELTAREAILTAGGDVELLAPHVVSSMSVTRDDTGITVTCQNGDVALDPASYVQSLRQRDSFKQAFITQEKLTETPVTSGGSGAHPGSAAPHNSISAEDPLAIGHALEAVARGERSVSH